MASTFAELYSDYQQQTKIYVEKLDVTELQFMRDITRGMQKFQRETNYIEAAVEITPFPDGNYYLPDDVLFIMELDDAESRRMVSQSWLQFSRNLELMGMGHIETPADFSTRLVYAFPSDYRWLYNYLHRFVGGQQDYSGIWTVWERKFYFYPDDSLDAVRKKYLRYVRDISAFSQSSPQWATWFPIDNNFMNMFTTTTVTPSLAPYEDAFLNYAIATFIKSQGSANYQVFERDFWKDVELAKINKPSYFNEGVSEYSISPWS